MIGTACAGGVYAKDSDRLSANSRTPAQRAASRAVLYQFFGKSGDAAKVLDVGQIARTAPARSRRKSRTSVG
jgi:hypothetical protein